MVAKLFASSGFTATSVAIGGLLGILFGTWTPLLTALLAVQIMDIATGILVGRKRKTISSGTFHDGIKKKVGMWILVILANIVDTTLISGVPVFKSGVSLFLTGGEGLSLLENLGKLGVPIPEFIAKFLVQLRDTNNDFPVDKEGEE